jgi:hypothetical protein
MKFKETLMKLKAKELSSVLLKLSLSLLAIVIAVYVVYVIAINSIVPSNQFLPFQEVKQLVQTGNSRPWVEVSYTLSPLPGQTPQFSYNYKLTNKSDRDIMVSWPILDKLIDAKGFGPILHVIKKDETIEFTVVSGPPTIEKSTLLVHIAGGQKPPWRHKLSDNYWYAYVRQICSGPVPK